MENFNDSTGVTSWPQAGTSAGSASGAGSTRGSEQGFADILREIGTSTKDLVQSEITLVTAELKQSTKAASQHLTQAVIFAALLAISVLPFLAFLVIGLGELMGGMYWLSSLIVAVVCAVVGGGMAYRAYKKITTEDVPNFARTTDRLKRDAEFVGSKVEDVKTAAKGEAYGSTIVHG